MSAAHDPEGSVHVFETVGIEEGNARVPHWYKLVLVLLFGFFAVYLWKYLWGAQPSAAAFRTQVPAAPAPSEPAPPAK